MDWWGSETATTATYSVGRRLFDSSQTEHFLLTCVERRVAHGKMDELVILHRPYRLLSQLGVDVSRHKLAVFVDMDQCNSRAHVVGVHHMLTSMLQTVAVDIDSDKSPARETPCAQQRIDGRGSCSNVQTIDMPSER